MGCSTSKERGSVLGRGSTQSPPVAPEPVEVEDHKPEALMSAATSTKASSFHTHSTEASSFYGFKGGGRSLASLGSTTAESMPQSEGGSELGSVSLFSSSSKRSTGFGADRLSEHSDEEEIDEDFEDDDVEPTTRSESRDTPGAKRPDLDPIKAEMSPSSRTQSKADTSASAIRRGISASPGEGKFSVPPSPSSVEEATGEKNPSARLSTTEEALAEAPVSTVQVLATREGSLSGRRGGVESVVGAKAEGTTSQQSPSTPRTEEASPAGGSRTIAATSTPSRSSSRKGSIGPFAFLPEAPMYVLPIAGLIAAGVFPKYQAAMRSGALVPHDALDRKNTFVVYVSHRWITGPNSRKSGADAAPDVDSIKHAILVEGLSSVVASLPREVAVFLWIDCSCVDQDDEESKRRAARSVAAYMQLSDAVFTPYAESLYPASSGEFEETERQRRRGASSGGGGAGGGHGAEQSEAHGRREAPLRASGEASEAENAESYAMFANPLGEVCDTAWPNSYRSLQDFCSRAWCRLETLLCATLPLRDGGFRYFAASGDEERAQDRPHFIFGDYQRRRKLPPEALTRTDDQGWAGSLDPLEGSLTDADDMEAIVHGMGPLRLATRSAAMSSGSSFPSLAGTPPHLMTRDEHRRSVRATALTPVRRTDRSPSASDRGSRQEGRAGADESAGGRGEASTRSGRRGGGGWRGAIPPPIEARVIPPSLADEPELASGARSEVPDRLMSPAIKGSKIMASPMRMRTAAADSAMVGETTIARGDSSMPGWLWDTVFQYPLNEGDTRTQYVDGSTFVGPLRDGMRHGNGAYFFQDGSRYEGSFRDDRRHGHGELILAGGGRYLGEWENDLQHGEGTFFFADTSCFKGLWAQGKKKSGVFTYSSGGRYIGELQGGRRHGRGSFLYPDGSSYEGQWQDNVKHGEGTAWYASGNRYVGQWRNGKSHGEGTYYYVIGARYEGQFDAGKCHGRGTYFYANGNKYEGAWKDDMKWGFGKAIYRKKAHYEGHFFMDKRHGFGRMWYSNAGTYEGEWASGKPHGHGTATHRDGEKYVGTYKAGLYHGEGCYWYTNGAIYEGEYWNGRVHGRGRATFPSGDSYLGEWKEGAMSGTGMYDFKAEGASYEGDFDNGRMQGVGVYRWHHGDVYRGSWEGDRRSGRGRYEWTDLGLTFEGTFRDDRRMGRGSIIFPDNSRYECQWENDKAMDSTAEGALNVHYRADGAECAGDCDVRCKEKGGDELRRLMRRINEQRMMQPVTPTNAPEAEQAAKPRTATALKPPAAASSAESVSDV